MTAYLIPSCSASITVSTRDTTPGHSGKDGKSTPMDILTGILGSKSDQRDLFQLEDKLNNLKQHVRFFFLSFFKFDRLIAPGAGPNIELV